MSSIYVYLCIYIYLHRGVMKGAGPKNLEGPYWDLALINI